MKFLGLLAVAFLVEVGASWWTWVRSPTDSLRALYLGSFLDYELDRLAPWSVLLMAAMFAWFVLHRWRKL